MPRKGFKAAIFSYIEVEVILIYNYIDLEIIYTGKII